MDMKYKWLLFVLVLGMVLIPISILWINRTEIDIDSNEVEDGVLKASTSNAAIDLEVNGNIYSVAWFRVSDIESVELFNNLDDRKNSQQIINDKGCSKLVNGGFYTEDYQPTGLLITDYETIGGYRGNRTHNGIFYITGTGDVGIVSDYDGEQYKHALQTGPILVDDGLTRKLNIRNDEPARRVVAAVTDSGNIIFATAFDKESHFLGPILSDLPNVIKTLSDEYGLDITDATNLDGKSASVFISDGVRLQELSTIGSYFCVRD